MPARRARGGPAHPSPSMKNLKQTTLSFTPLPRRVDACCSSQGSASLAPASAPAPPSTTAKTQKAKQASTTRQRASKFDCVEIPPKRTAPAKVATRKSASKSKSASAAEQPRKMSLKRKHDTNLDPNTGGDLVPVPRINVDPASSPGQSSRAGPLVAKDNNCSVDLDEKGPSLKKLRLSSPLSALTSLPPSSPPSSVRDETDMDDIEVVPTSQSNEEELTFDPSETVKSWRKGTIADLPSRSGSPSNGGRYYSPLSDVPMDVDFDPFTTVNNVPETPVQEVRFQYPHTPNSSTGEPLVLPASDNSAAIVPEGASREAEQRKAGGSPADAFRSLTPPPSSDAEQSMEPEEDIPIVQPLDIKSKTEQIIADIRARAMAGAHSSPEPQKFDIDDISDSDSDSDSSDDGSPGKLVAALVRDTKGKGKAIETSSPSNVSVGETPRYNLRRASPSNVKKVPVPATQPRKRKTDPLTALLREREREERTGTGMVAVRFAEQAVARRKAGLLEEMADEEDDSDSDSDGESRAKSRKGKGKHPIAGPSRRGDGEESDDEDAVLAKLNYAAFLGKKSGEAVEKILANDVREKMAMALAKQNEQPLGMPFWSPASEDGGVDMDAEVSIPAFTADVGGHSIRQVLKTISERNDASQLSALLSAGMVTFLRPEQYTVVIPWLFDTAFSGVKTSLALQSYTQLRRLGLLVGSQPSGLRLSNILTALRHLGASSHVLERHGWSQAAKEASALNRASDAEWRDEMLYRLVSLIGAFAQSLVREELGDILLALMLVGMDPATPDHLQTEALKVCDVVTETMTLSQEFAACTKIVNYGRTLAPANQALLVSFMPCICPQSVRMARCVGRALLLDSTPSPSEYEQGLPDLVSLIALLSPPPGSGGYFDVPGNSDKEGYYDDLTCRLSILAKVLSDIDEYALAEKQAAKRRSADEDEEQEQDPEKREEGLTVLEQVTRQLDLLHGKIVDTRAAHLDRSRAKAALQRLSFRVHYQRVATLKSGLGIARPKNLLGYFHGGSA